MQPRLRTDTRTDKTNENNTNLLKNGNEPAAVKTKYLTYSDSTIETLGNICVKKETYIFNTLTETKISLKG